MRQLRLAQGVMPVRLTAYKSWIRNIARRIGYEYYVAEGLYWYKYDGEPKDKLRTTDESRKTLDL